MRQSSRPAGNEKQAHTIEWLKNKAHQSVAQHYIRSLAALTGEIGIRHSRDDPSRMQELNASQLSSRCQLLTPL